MGFERHFPSVAAFVGRGQDPNLVLNSLCERGVVCANCIAYQMPSRCGHAETDTLASLADLGTLMRALEYYKANPAEFWECWEKVYGDFQVCDENELRVIKAVFPDV